MQVEKRNRLPEIPQNLEKYLNDDQMLALHHAERYGWHLAFIRRPLFMEPMAVLFGPAEGQIATLELNGDINETPDIILRH